MEQIQGLLDPETTRLANQVAKRGAVDGINLTTGTRPMVSRLVSLPLCECPGSRQLDGLQGS